MYKDLNFFRVTHKIIDNQMVALRSGRKALFECIIFNIVLVY